MSTPQVAKRVPHEWFEGHKIEDRAVSALKPAFARAVRHIQAAVDDVIELALENPAFNIAIAFGSLPWDAFQDELRKAWAPVAERVFFQAGVLAAKDRPRTIKAVLVLKVTDERVRRLAENWAMTHALDLAEVTSLGSQAGVRQALIQSITQNRSILDVARDIRSMVGITERDVLALGNLRIRLEEQGLAASRVNARIKTKANQMRRRRAENIARTEINSARNRGTFSVWREATAMGDLPGLTHKQWIANGACPICENIVANGPVPLNQPFDTARGPAMTPPAHPSCRCSMGLAVAPA